MPYPPYRRAAALRAADDGRLRVRRTASELTALRSELDAAVSELNALRDELSAAEARLDEARAQNDALTHRVEDLEAAGEYPIFRRTLSNGVTLIYETQLLDIAYDPLEERRAHELYVRFADGEKRLLGSSVSSIGVSPDETRLLYNVGFSGSADSGRRVGKRQPLAARLCNARGNAAPA